VKSTFPSPTRHQRPLLLLLLLLLLRQLLSADQALAQRRVAA